MREGMFRLLGSESTHDDNGKRGREEALSRELEELKRENELLKKQIAEVNLRLQREVTDKERKAFEEGLRRGREETLRELGNLISTLSEMSRKAQVSYEEALKSSREIIVDLVFKIVEKLLPEIKKHSLDVALTSVKEMVSSFLTSSTELKIVYLSPQDYQKLKELLQTDPELKKLEEKFQLVFEEDSELSPGDVVIKTEALDVDGRLKTKLEELRKYVLENLNV